MNKFEILKNKKTIEDIFDKGIGFKHYPFFIKYLKSDTTETMFTIPKKKIGLANKRNLIKRRCKNIYNLFSNYSDINIIFVYLPKQVLKYSELETKLKEIFEKVKAIK